jgi:hypothetical protein
LGPKVLIKFFFDFAMPLFQAITCYKQLGQHVLVGMGAASFWRGAWYVLDDHLFPDDPETSALTCLGLGTLGLRASQGLVARAERLMHSHKHRPVALATARFGALYTIAVSCVLVWRGTWVGWDCLYEKMHPQKEQATSRGHATHSGLLSHVTAVTMLLGTGAFASVLAPPAAVSIIRDLAVRGGKHKPVMGTNQLVQRLFPGRAYSTLQRAPRTQALRYNRHAAATKS